MKKTDKHQPKLSKCNSILNNNVSNNYMQKVATIIREKPTEDIELRDKTVYNGGILTVVSMDAKQS